MSDPAATQYKRSETPFGPRDAGVPMSLEEFERADFEPGFRYELIHGVLVVTPPPLEEERDANEELGRWLRNYQESHPSGGVLDLTLPEQNLRTREQNRRCDRAIWVGLGRPPRTRGPVERRDLPAIVVEFDSARRSDQRRDYDEKQLEYRDLGIREYWIIDRFSRTMTVYASPGGAWRKLVLTESESCASDLLPGFRLHLDKLFAVTEKYRDLE